MLRGLWRLTWLEIKIFVREPLGVVGTLALPVLIYVGLARMAGPRGRNIADDAPRFLTVDLPILTSVVLAVSSVLSLVAIIAIYREGGILRRLRATPLRPHTILIAHVIVKLLLTVITLIVMLLAGRRSYPLPASLPIASFAVALLFSTVVLLSLGFLIASVVPTARFAQPFGTLVLYPMLGLSGLFFPIESLPPLLRAVARVLPLTYAVPLMRGIWHGDGWARHAGDVLALTVMFVVFLAVSARVFRWE